MAALLRYSSVSLRGSDPNRVAVCPAAIYVTYTLCGDEYMLRQFCIKVKFSAVFMLFFRGRAMVHRQRDMLLIMVLNLDASWRCSIVAQAVMVVKCVGAGWLIVLRPTPV